MTFWHRLINTLNFLVIHLANYKLKMDVDYKQYFNIPLWDVNPETLQINNNKILN